MKILTADYILPIVSDPIPQGAVAVEKNKIVFVGSRSEVQKRFPESSMEDFGAAAILPGFINTHSHLELTAMRGFLDRYEHDFASWLLTIAVTRAEKLSDDDIKTSAMLGAIEGARAGVTCFADIGRHAVAGFEALNAIGLRGIVFQETEFCPKDETADKDFELLKEKYLSLQRLETPLVRVGISPHSPYTVSRKLLENISDYSLQKTIPLTIHAAESTDELKFMLRGEGYFAEIYKKFGIEWRAPEISSIEFLKKHGALSARPLLAHCVKVSESDIELIGESDSSVAHCPKSNAKFGHGIAPLEKFFERRIRVGFGSDSVASNNLCDMLEEARFATLFARTRTHDAAHISAKEILFSATLGGARALRLEERIGSLEAGKDADITVVSLNNAAQVPVHDVESALLFASSARDVVLTMVAGDDIYREGKIEKHNEKETLLKISEIAIRMRT